MPLHRDLLAFQVANIISLRLSTHWASDATRYYIEGLLDKLPSIRKLKVWSIQYDEPLCVHAMRKAELYKPAIKFKVEWGCMWAWDGSLFPGGPADPELEGTSQRRIYDPEYEYRDMEQLVEGDYGSFRLRVAIETGGRYRRVDRATEAAETEQKNMDWEREEETVCRARLL